MKKLTGVLQSRKFYASLVALAVALFGDRAGVDQETLTHAVAVVIAYILGTALESGLSGRV